MGGFLQPPCLRTHICYRIWFLLSWEEFTTEQRKGEAGRERASISVSFRCLSAGLRVPRITGSASWARRLWQINTLPLDLMKHKYFNVPNGRWLQSQLSGTPNFCKHGSPLGNPSEETMTSSRPRYRPDSRCMCLHMYKLLLSGERRLKLITVTREYVLIRILDSFPLFDAGKQETPMSDFFYLVLFDSEQQPGACLGSFVPVQDICYKTPTDLVEISCRSFSFLHLSV